MKLIAIIGKKGSGKTTLADMLVSERGFVKASFKEALIGEIRHCFPRLLEDASSIYGISIDELFIEKPAIIRHLLQEYGTEVRRGDDVNYWVNKLRKKLDVYAQEDKDIVVDDCRFMNEYALLRMEGAVFIRINRDGLESDSHASETELDFISADIDIDNNKTEEELKALARRVIE